jgi:hypothetical protein
MGFLESQDQTIPEEEEASSGKRENLKEKDSNLISPSMASLCQR